MAGDITDSKTIPGLMDAIKETYSIEVPIIPTASPLSALWDTPITVTEGSLPEPNYTAAGSIVDEFPFSFIKVISPQLALAANLNITVFEAPPPEINTRGLKATVFQVPISETNPSGVIVKRGVTFVDQGGVRVPEESVVPNEA